MRLYSPVDFAGNLIMIEKLVLGRGAARDVNEATTLRGRGRDPRGRGQDPRGRGRGRDPRGRGRGQVHEAAEVWKTEKIVMVH